MDIIKKYPRTPKNNGIILDIVGTSHGTTSLLFKLESKFEINIFEVEEDGEKLNNLLKLLSEVYF